MLILRDVLGWPAKDVADLLGDSVNSVNSALQRARAGMREHLPAERQDWTGGEEDAATRDLVRRFADASVAADVDTLAAMLRDDVRCSMPPVPGLQLGRDAVVADWVEGGYSEMQGLRAVATAVNRQPAFAYYHWREHEVPTSRCPSTSCGSPAGRSPRSPSSVPSSSPGSTCPSAWAPSALVEHDGVGVGLGVLGDLAAPRR